MTLDSLLDRWTASAAELDRFGASAQAKAVRQCIADLRAELEAHDAALLTLAEASTWSGYSKRRIRELVSEGKLENHGATGSPRFRRSELPRKAKTSSADFDVDGEVARLLEAS